jgi:tubulin polyglutamylase TTLL4
MHLTNFTINKTSGNFIRFHDHVSPENSKWSLPFFYKYLETVGLNKSEIQSKIENAALLSIIAGFCKIRAEHRRLKRHRKFHFELMGVDLILDANLNPYVCEVNISPDMNCSDSELDYRMKSSLLHDVYHMAQIVDTDPKDPSSEVKLLDDLVKKSITKERVKNVVEEKENPWKNPVFWDMQIIREFVNEQNLRRGFHRVYPKRATLQNYKDAFDEFDYFDIVLESWVFMNNNSRRLVIEKNLQKYRDEIEYGVFVQDQLCHML